MLYSRSNDRWKETVRRGLGSSRTFQILKSPRNCTLTLIPLDVLNRFSDSKSSAQTIHVMKYIFPRQCGLQHVFAPTSRNGTADQFKAHASREKEIAEAAKPKKPRHLHYIDDLGNSSLKLPKRLRGQTVDLVRAMRVRHARCSYSELLKYYCPTDVSPFRPMSTCFSLTATVDWTLETSLGSFSREKARRQWWTRVVDG